MPEPLDRGLTRGVAVLIAVGVALRVAFLLWGNGVMVDDAYITVRCAEHLAAGEGLVYNVGERVLCVTSPFYAVLVAALIRTAPVAAIGYVIGAVNIAFFGLAAWWLADLLKGAGRWITLLALVLFAVYLPFADNSTVGMETPLFLLGIVGSIHLLRGRTLAWLSLVLALLILVRPEGVLWLISILVTMRLLRVPVRPGVMLPGLAVCLAWLAISVPYYGSPVPLSILAKSGLTGASQSGISARAAFTTIQSLALLRLPGDWARFVPVAGALQLAPVVPALVLFGVGAWRLVRTRSLLLSFALLYVLYVGFYVLARGRTDFSWYGVPSGLAFWVVVSVGIAVVAKRVFPKRLRERLARVVVPAGAALLVLAGTAAWRADRMTYYNLVATSYRQAGEYVAGHAASDAVALVDEAGMIGWRAGITVRDLAGITCPDVLAQWRRGGRGFGAVAVAKDMRPDFIVLCSTRYAGVPEVDGRWLDEHYLMAAEFSFHVVLERRATPS